MIYIQNQKCLGCGACIHACPVGAIQLINGLATIDQDKCQQCEACLTVCPENAIVTILDLEPISTAPISVPSHIAGVQRTTVKASLLPWMGAALAFVGREVLPRVIVSLLDAWDHRTQQSTALSGKVTSISPTSFATPVSSRDQLGHKHRQRRRGQF